MPERPGYFMLPEAVGVPLSKEELAAVVHESCREMAASMRFERMAALSYDPAEQMLRLVTSVGFSLPNFRSIGISAGDCPQLHQVLQSGKIGIRDSAAGCLPDPLARHFTGPLALVPLLIGERRIAVLCGQAMPGVSFHSATWRKEVEGWADKAALVAECERLQAAYQDMFQQQARTRNLALAILEQQELSRVLRLIARHLEERFEIDRCALYLCDETGFQVAYRQNVSEEYTREAARVSPLVPRIEEASRTLQPFVIEDPTNVAEYAPLMDLARKEGITTIAVAPLQYGKELQGALCLYPPMRRSFTPLEMTAFKMIADQTSLAIAVSRSIEQQRDAAALRERNRLAREIHDTLAQALTGIVLQLEAADSMLDKPDAARELLTDTRALARNALEETRRSVAGLTATPLERLALADALRQELDSFGHQAKLRTAFIMTGEERPLSTEQKTAVFRIAQEAMHNIRKHARAERVRVALRYEESLLSLTVEDDGIGFDPEAARVPGTGGGYGLYGMQERARLQGGEVRIESAEGWGTRVVVHLPYERQTLPQEASPGALRSRGPMTGERSSAPTPVPALPVSKDEPGIRVVIADDHAVARQGLRRMLESAGDIAVLGEAADGMEALRQVAALSPDVLLLDIQMPRLNGLQTLQRLQSERPGLPVLIVTTFDTDEMLLQCIRAGAKGYLLKDAAPAHLIEAVRAVHRGESLLQPAMTGKLLERLREDKTARAKGAELNEREREILALLVTGARNKEIAARLFITEKTVEFHLSNLFAKLGVANRTEAARYALDHGLVTTSLEPD